MSVVKDFALTTPLLGNQSFTSPVVDFLSFNTLSTASFYNTTDATQTTQQILFQFSAERTQNFNFNEIVTMTLNQGLSKSFPIRARFGRYVITNTSSTAMTELRLSSLAFEEIQEVGINQVVDLEATLQAEDQRITDEIAARIAGDLNLQNQVFLKANQTDLNAEQLVRANADIALEQALALRATTDQLLSEQAARESADVLLQLNINAESTARQLADNVLQGNIDTENQARVSADTALESNLNFKLDKSRSIDSNLAFYATNRQSLSAVLSTITAGGSVLSLGSGSYGNLTDDPLVIDKQNIAVHSPPTGTNICEILSPVTIPTTADRLRFQGITFDGNVILNASRSVYRRCDFTENVNIGEGATGFITIRDCEFVAGKTITVSNTFGNVLYFINCNFASSNLVLNQASNQQVIFNNCANFVSFPVNATYVGINVLNNGYTKNDITKTILPSGSGTAGQVLTSGGANNIDTWTTIDLQGEIDNRIAGDALLAQELNDQRTSNETNFDNIQFALADKLNSNRSIDSNLAFYATQGDDLSVVLSTISAPGSVLSLGSGSFGSLEDTPLVIDKINMAIHAPSATSNICEILSPVTIPTSADRIRIRFVAFDGNCILNAKRSVYNQCAFTENVSIGEGATGFITFKDCEFVSGKTITVSNTFASALFFVNCNFSGATLVLNQSLPTQVILTNCAGLVSFPTNATLGASNALTTGFINNSIAKTILPSGVGEAGQVLTSSGSATIPDTWTTPSGGGGGGNDSGKCLEMIHLYPKGQSVTSVRNDTLTFQNVTERQLLTQSAADLTGSVISYRPPTGTTKVIYTFYTHLSNRALVNSNNDANFRVFFGSTQVTVARQYVSLAQASATGYHEFSVVFNIGGTENIANAVLGSWNSLVQLKWDGARQSQTEDFHIHNLLGFDELTVFSSPKIKIEAYA